MRVLTDSAGRSTLLSRSDWRRALRAERIEI